MSTKSDRLDALAESVTSLQEDLSDILDAVGDLRAKLNHLDHDLHNILGEVDSLVFADIEAAAPKAG